MTLAFSIFKLLAGVGLFLFAMYLLEESLKNLSGRRFKIFLQRATKNRIGAVAGGTLVTGILQSSSMVSLMVLAFVGAGVITMKNAVAVILGANLGTTLGSWLVAGLGFKVDVEIAAYPSVFLGGLLLIIFNNKRNVRNISFLLLGFGLLFIALGFMRSAMEVYVKGFDFSVYHDMPVAFFVLTGFIITLLVQSSSVTMALTLSALNAGVFGLLPAAAIVLGSETGTTIKILVGAAGGSASKKRVALGNFIFNLFLMIGSYFLLNSLVLLVTNILGVVDPLFALVTFSSLINLLAIVIMLPLLGPFTKILGMFFKDSDGSAAAFISQANVKEPQSALELFRRETAFFLYESKVSNLSLLEVDTRFLNDREKFHLINEKRKFFSLNSDERYNFLKLLQGELQALYLTLRSKVSGRQSVQLNQMIIAVRSAMYSVKCINDVRKNISNLKRSSKEVKFDFFMHSKQAMVEIYELLDRIEALEKDHWDAELKKVFEKIQNNYEGMLEHFYSGAQQSELENLDLTTAINFNRELYTSHKAMLMAVKNFLLNEREGVEFSDLSDYRV